MLDQTLKCPICGKPYKFYSMLCKDQSACPKCVEEAEKAEERKKDPRTAGMRESANGRKEAEYGVYQPQIGLSQKLVQIRPVLGSEE